MLKIIKILYIKWRFRLKYWLSPKILSEYVYLKDKKKCYVFLAADYGNLGDVAITFAQEKFLKEKFPEYEIVDVPISMTLSHLKAIKNISTTDDIVTIVGGGNMSDLYFDIELLRQMVINTFPNNRVISFPQTMFFSKTMSGKYLRRQAVKTYSKHNNLIVTSREKWSYELMKALLTKCKLLPDIVMTLDKREPAVTERNGVTLCLRDDAESGLSIKFKAELRAMVKEVFNVVEYDTHIGRGNLSLEERENELNKIWAQFRSSEWVVTDRLHGMIFAFITGTPCVVLPNNMSINQIVTLLQSKSLKKNFDTAHKIIISRINEILET